MGPRFISVSGVNTTIAWTILLLAVTRQRSPLVSHLPNCLRSNKSLECGVTVCRHVIKKSSEVMRTPGWNRILWLLRRGCSSADRPERLLAKSTLPDHCSVYKSPSLERPKDTSREPLSDHRSVQNSPSAGHLKDWTSQPRLIIVPLRTVISLLSMSSYCWCCALLWI